jgi:hypothetical protein
MNHSPTLVRTTRLAACISLAFGVSMAFVSFSSVAAGKAELRSAGALTFSSEGVLFIGDNLGGAVFAYPTNERAPAGTTPTAGPLDIDRIDERIAPVLGTPAAQLTINGMAVHPVSREVYLSVTRGRGDLGKPALVKVSADGKISKVALNGTHTRFEVPNPPSADERFRDRTGDWPVPGPAKYKAKAQTPMRTMIIVDMKHHAGELYISGISNEEFASTLRRVKYPFTGEASASQVRIYHVAHERYETRAPIRAMTFANVDGQDTLIAGYTCSPLVLIPVSDLKDGAKVTGRTIGDMGNGQPLSMVPVKLYGQDMIYVTNAAHAPRMIPVAGMQKAVAYLPENSPKNYPSDLSPEYPLGPVGKGVMFVGASLRADKLNDKFLVSLTRDTQSGALNLEALPIEPLPMKLDQIWSEFDFKGGGPIPAPAK